MTPPVSGDACNCPRCGYDLRAQVAACRADGRERVVCTECGLDLAVAQLLEHQSHPWLFEYHWRIRPIRRCLTTYVRAHDPRSFWRSVRMLDRMYLVPPAVVLLLVVGALWGLSLFSRARTGAVFRRRIPRSVDWVDELTRLLEIDLRHFGPPLAVAIALPLLVVIASRFVWRVRIRAAHVVRVTFYSLVLPLTITLGWATAMAIVSLLRVRGGWRYSLWSMCRRWPEEPSRLLHEMSSSLPLVIMLLAVIVWFGLWWRCACRQYIQVPSSGRVVDRVLVYAAIALVGAAVCVELWLRYPTLFGAG